MSENEPPDGMKKISDVRYVDKRDMAHNTFWTSTDELQGLWLLLKKDPKFENSTDDWEIFNLPAVWLNQDKRCEVLIIHFFYLWPLCERCFVYVTV